MRNRRAAPRALKHAARSTNRLATRRLLAAESLEPRLVLEGAVSFNEIMYHPTTGVESNLEWVELYNQQGVEMDLSGWRLSGDVDYIFPANTYMPPGSYLVVAASPTALQSATGFSAAKGPWTGTLPNNDGHIVLRDNIDRINCEIHYDVENEWPTGANGGGVSLAKIVVDSAADVGTNWKVSDQLNGTPGAANFPPFTATPVSSVVVSPTGSWKFDASNVAPAANWNTLGYNDASWSTGNGLLGGGDASAPISVANSSFEAGALNPPPGLGPVDGWTGVGNTGSNELSGTLNNNNVIPDGARVGVIQYVGSLSQSVTDLEPGKKYTVKYYENERGLVATNKASASVTLGATTVVAAHDVSKSTRARHVVSQPFTADSTTATLTFANAAANVAPFGDNALLLDKVEVTRAVPLIGNGNLEAYVPSGTFVINPNGSPGVAWTFAGTAGLSRNGSPFQAAGGGNPVILAPEGNQIGFLTNASTMTQTVSGFELGVTYSISWREGRRTNLGNANDLEIVLDAGLPTQTVLSAAHLVSSASLVEQTSGNFSATKASYTLTLRTTNPLGGSSTTFIDDLNFNFVSDAPQVTTPLPLGASTYYFRAPFSFDGVPTDAQLKLNYLADDGAVFYLNGQEIYRTSNMLAGQTHGTPASTAVGNPVFSGQITVPAAALVNGPNLLAVEVHQASPDGGDVFFGAELTTVVTPQPPSTDLVLNEVSGGVDASTFVEITNIGAASVSTAGVKIVNSLGGEFSIPTQSLAPGAKLSFNQATLGFHADTESIVFLKKPSGNRIPDAIVVKSGARGRLPDGTGPWYYETTTTPGAANTIALHDEIVINEVLYHHKANPAKELVQQTYTPITTNAVGWKYDQSNVDLGAGWRAAGYDDSAWSSGQGVFYAGPIQGTIGGVATQAISGLFNTGVNNAGIVLAAGQPDPHYQVVVNAAGAAPIAATVQTNHPAWTANDAQSSWIGVTSTGTDNVADGNYNFRTTFDLSGTAFNTAVLTISVLVDNSLTDVLINGQSTGISAAGFAGAFLGPFTVSSGFVPGINTLEFVTNNAPGPGANPGGFRAKVSGTVQTIPLNTQLALGANTYYFRKSFNITGNPAATALTLTSFVDDGAAFYINGTQVYSQNLPAVFTHATSASTNVGQPSYVGPITLNIPANLLVSGNNVLAVEVHQSSEGPIDVAFTAALTAIETITAAADPAENPEEWVELYNRSNHTVDLTGWRLDSAADYSFTPGTTIAPGQYLVVARNAAALQALHPTATIIGNLANNLPNGGGTIELKDSLGNLADFVPYEDHGRWPELADGGGVSLELKDPDSDNSVPEAWAYSDESSRTTWQTYTYRGVANPSTGNDAAYNEFIMGLLDAGEVLVDDIHVYADPDGARIDVLQNGSFEALGAQRWRLLGNHSHSEVIVDPTNAANHVLRMVATGPTEHMLNHAETTLKNGATFYTITNGTTFEITYRAKWIAGANLLNSRLYFNRLAKTTEIAVPSKTGTPGAPNTRMVANAGPTYANFQHGPVIPAANQAVTVSAVANDPDGVASMEILYSVNGGGFLSVPMTAQGGGLYSGTIPGHAASAIVQFYVRGTDALGATSTFPGLGTASRAIYKVSDGVAMAAGMHNFRVLMTAADTTLLYTSTNVMSDDPMRATVLYDDNVVFYDVQVSLQGSERGRDNSDRVGLHIYFSPDKLFRGTIKSVSFDHSGGYALGTASGRTDEILVKQLRNRAGFGLPTQYDDQVNLIASNPAKSGTGILLTERYGNDMLDNTYEDGGDGTVYKMELIYYPLTTNTGTPEGLKLPQPDDVVDIEIRDLGNSKENYRQNFIIQSNRDYDDYSRMIDLGKAFSLSGAALDAATKDVIDVDQWARVFGALSLGGVGDSYGQGYGHNLQMYVRPEDNKMLAMPWDWDFAYVQGTNAALFPAGNIGKVLNLPGNQRIFYWNMRDLIATAFNTTYINHAATALSATVGQNWAARANYLINRSSFVASQLPAQIPFVITTNGGADITNLTTDTVTLSGNAWFDARNIYVQGRATPLDLTWTTNSTWTATIPLAPGANTLTLIGRDPRGNQVGTDTITVTTSGGIQLQSTLRVTEIQYHAADPTAAELLIDPTFTQDDFEYIEIQNIGAQTIDLAGVQIVDDVNFTFTNTFVGGTPSLLLPGERVVVVESLAGFAARYNTAGLKIAGEFAQDLSNSGGTLELRDNLGQTIQLFTYDDNGPGWYPTTDGDGPSLVIRNPLAPAATWNDAASWRPSSLPFGSPGIDEPSTAVVARRVFYNQSSFDNQDAAANTADDGAMATDKSALLPGGVATLANYTSYSRGINGVMLDISGLAGASLAASDFTFRVGNDNSPAAWGAAPSPTSIAVRAGAGAGGSSRVTLTWADGAIRNTWLQVTVLANANTGLATPDVFYFGNAVGESGGNGVVNSTDEIATRTNNRPFTTLAPIDFLYDYNRDRLVNATDQILARSNSTTLAMALKLISVPAALQQVDSSVRPLALSSDERIATALAAPATAAARLPGTTLSEADSRLVSNALASVVADPVDPIAPLPAAAPLLAASASDEVFLEEELYDMIAADLIAKRLL